MDDADTIDDNGRNCVKTSCNLSWTPPESVQVNTEDRASIIIVRGNEGHPLHNCFNRIAHTILTFAQGSSLIKYTICKTEDYCSWGLAGTVPGNTLTCRVDNLVAGTVVQFNVIASNGVGDSKPSDTSPMYYVIGQRVGVYY